MLEPPGTIRTRSASVVGRTGYVSLSKKRKLGCGDMSTSAPIRKPKDAALHPGIDAPRPVCGPFGRANLTAGEPRPKLGEQRPVGVAVALGRRRGECLDAITQRHAPRLAGGQAPRAPRAGGRGSAPEPARGAADSAPGAAPAPPARPSRAPGSTRGSSLPSEAASGSGVLARPPTRLGARAR